MTKSTILYDESENYTCKIKKTPKTHNTYVTMEKNYKNNAFIFQPQGLSHDAEKQRLIDLYVNKPAVSWKTNKDSRYTRDQLAAIW